jgi:hypothetical protein
LVAPIDPSNTLSSSTVVEAMPGVRMLSTVKPL